MLYYPGSISYKLSYIKTGIVVFLYRNLNSGSALGSESSCGAGRSMPPILPTVNKNYKKWAACGCKDFVCLVTTFTELPSF